MYNAKGPSGLCLFLKGLPFMCVHFHFYDASTHCMCAINFTSLTDCFDDKKVSIPF